MNDHQLAEAFVSIADTLADDFETVGFLSMVAGRCVSLLDVAAAGLMVTDLRRPGRVVAASDEETRRLQVSQLEREQGPGLDCLRLGAPIVVTDLAAAAHLWPWFAVETGRIGYLSVHTLPMRLRAQTIGALSLYRTQTGPCPSDSIRLGQALADMATIGLLQEQAIRAQSVINRQLQIALNHRVVIEQAKGVLAERHRIRVEGAFAMLRRVSRDRNYRLTDLARAVVDRTEMI
jgi:hypothetical protein